MRRFLVVACAVLLAALPASAAVPHWVGSWAASPQPPSAQGGGLGANRVFKDQTIRQIVRITAGGKRVRVRLTNEYGTKPLVIGAATVAIASATGEVTGPVKPLTFGGKPQVTIPAGAPMVSDPVSLTTEELASLSISLYLPGDTGPCTCHATGVQTAYISETPGDFTKAAFASKTTFLARAFISGVDVETPGWGKAIVVFGDSISDGYRSTNDANKRWPDRLAERLHERWPGQAWAVVNAGISGNRVLSGGMGDSALTRFDRDVLSVPGAEYLIVFEGVNDLGMGVRQGGIPTLEAMQTGYRQILSRAKDRGMTVYIATIAPYEGAAYYSPEGEAVRQQINSWIRGQKEFDGVIDFDAAWRDPANPKRIKADLQVGDWLHGNDAGYKVLGDAVPLKLFN